MYTSGESYEPEAIHHTREWLKESDSRQLYVIGPMLPPGIGQLPPAGVPLLGSEQSSGDIESWKFMDKILDTHGINSLVYVSYAYPVYIILDCFTKLDYYRYPSEACGGRKIVDAAGLKY